MAGERRRGNADEGGMPECPTGSSSRTKVWEPRHVSGFMRAHACIYPMSNKRTAGRAESNVSIRFNNNVFKYFSFG